MTNNSPTFQTQLPEGYMLRARKPLAASTRKSAWRRDWSFMLRDLWLGGGFAWQRWGSGHTSSGITNALLNRGHIEIAEAPKQPLLFRLTNSGRDHALELIEEYVDAYERTGVDLYTQIEPPEGAPQSYRPATRVLTDPDDIYYEQMLVSDIKALDENIAQHDTYAADPEYAPFIDSQVRKSYMEQRSKAIRNLHMLRSAAQ